MPNFTSKTEAYNQALEDRMMREAEVLLSRTLKRTRFTVDTQEAVARHLIDAWNHATPKRIKGGVHINRTQP